MISLKRTFTVLLAIQIGLAPILGQILLQPQSHPAGGSGISNLRVVKQTADGTEVLLAMDFVYDGINGPDARILPEIADKKQPGIAKWFGTEPATIGVGHGTIQIRVKFFNDDPGVPPQVTTDRIRVRMFSSSGNSVVSQNLFLKTINWGSPGAVTTPAETTPPPLQTMPKPLKKSRRGSRQNS